MTVFEMFDRKYRESMKKMNRVAWQNTMLRAEETKQHPAKVIYMGLEITETDIRDNGGWTGEFWKEIDSMHNEKLLASNKHRQYGGQVTKYWLTKKGFNALNKDGAIC